MLDCRQDVVVSNTANPTILGEIEALEQRCQFLIYRIGNQRNVTLVSRTTQNNGVVRRALMYQNKHRSNVF